ncbi:MAG: DUF1573 domain-containing protein [Limisphaerales bacterium]
MRSLRLRTTLALSLVLAGLACPPTGLAQPAQSLQNVPSPQPLIPTPPVALHEGDGKLDKAAPAPPVIPFAPVPPPQGFPPRVSAQYTPRLAWDSDFKQSIAKPGETNAQFAFSLTNISTIDVVVNRVTTSCGCTVARLPSVPWRLQPGASGQIDVTVDLRNKWGTLQKFITVDTSDGFKPLRVQITIPTQTTPPPHLVSDRSRKKETARADRQAVFKGDCARCHAAPVVGKMGNALFQAACAICHESDHRATMVPDLRALNHATDRQFWKSWIVSGKPGTLMPAFATTEGGPLTEAQVDSLTDYVSAKFPQRTAIIPVRPPPPPPPLPPARPRAGE